MPVERQTKAVVTVAEMARMVGLSRARFYQLVAAGTFPQPLYDMSTKRPHYVEEQQVVCLEVRRRNCGVDGKPVLFYARRVGAGAPRASTTASASTPAPRSRPTKPPEDPLVASIKALGLTSVTAAEVRAAVAEVFPKGVTGIDQGTVVRAVFLRLKCRNPADSAG
jgi:hypothetical protein